MASKSGLILVKMTSTGLTADGRPTQFFYVKKRNPKRLVEKLSLRKFDPRAVFANEDDYKSSNGDASNRKRGIHVLFTEKKMPNPKVN
jgi:large subunit ribosomal protein L33